MLLHQRQRANNNAFQNLIFSQQGFNPGQECIGHSSRCLTDGYDDYPAEAMQRKNSISDAKSISLASNARLHRVCNVEMPQRIGK